MVAPAAGLQCCRQMLEVTRFLSPKPGNYAIEPFRTPTCRGERCQGQTALPNQARSLGLDEGDGERVMLRVRLFAAATIVIGIALAGCSSSGDWFKSSPPPPQVLQFQSQPPGATVQTAAGQTCSTPCSLALSVSTQAVSFSLNGYVPQAIQLSVRQPESTLFSSPPPTLVPNPVVAMLQPVPAPPPPPPVEPKPRRTAAKPKPVAPKPAMRAPTQPAAAAPAQAPPQDNVFPPPPQTR